MLGLFGAFALGAACCALVLRRRGGAVGLPVIIGGAVVGAVCLAATPFGSPAPVGFLDAGADTTTSAPAITSITSTEATTTATETTDAEVGDDAEVASVVDGDTVDVVIDGARERVRLIGINAPERGECFADEATATLVGLLGGERLILTPDRTERDRYGRLLHYIHLADGRFVNEELVAHGVARAVSHPPDTAHDDVLAAAQTRARQARVGMWAADACGSPTSADLGFSAAVFDPPGDDLHPVTGERVTVTNRADASIDLTGWVIADEGPHRFPFPDGFRLGGGESVTVYSACGVEAPGFLYWCNQGSAVWNNSGDTAFLWDPSGNVVDSTGPFGIPPVNR